MIANEGYLVRFLDGGDKKFIIPVYQRNYSWKKSNCELLFKDLIGVYKDKQDSHFFGSIVYVANDIGGITEYLIIDGQQRLTTVSLLLLAIKNYVIANKINTTINTDKIYSAYITDQYSNDDKKLKLKLVQGDDEAYDKLVLNDEPIITSNITANYNYFYNKLGSLDIKEIEGLYSAITKLMIVNISLNPSNGDDPQVIFESLNSTGLALDESDKIRNYILMGQETKQQEKIYKNYWMKIEEKTHNETSKFVRHYLAVKTRILPNESKLYYSFKDYCESKKTLNIEELLSDLLKYAGFYEQIQKADGTKGYLASIKRINYLEMGTIYPFLFDLFKAKEDNRLSSDEMDEIMSLLESYIVRRNICGLQASALNKIFTYLGAEIDKYCLRYENLRYVDSFKYAILNKSQKSRFPNNQEFEEKFKTFELYAAKPSFKKYILERLENFNNKEVVDVYNLVENQTLTIEHIMPQTLSDDWKIALGEDWYNIHFKYLHTIGNLTLSAYNSDYSNLQFKAKRDMVDKGFSCSKLYLNQELKSKEVWTVKEIEERASILFKKALMLWGFSKSDFEPKTIEEWNTLDDEEIDFKNKLILKYNFMGDEVSCSNITDMYQKVFKSLFELDSVSLINNSTKYWGNDKNNMRRPIEISKNFFLETNLSSSDKISILKSAIETLGIQSDDLTFLIKDKNDSDQFDFYDINSYEKFKIGKLSELIFSKILQDELIDQSMVNKLLEKDYTKNTFGVYYPILATDKNANKGNSELTRYKAQSYKYKNQNYYLTREWFEQSRDLLVDWVKNLNL